MSSFCNPCSVEVRPVCVDPPVICASAWPSSVSQVQVACRVGCPHQDQASAVDLHGPWLLSSFGPTCKSKCGPPKVVCVKPCCVTPAGEEFIATFRDLEVDASAPGVISIALCPAESGHAGGQPSRCRVDAIPLIVTSSPHAAAELVTMFDTMLNLVAAQQQQQQQQHQLLGEQAPCGPRCSCSMGGASAAAMQDAQRTTWQHSFLPLLLDLSTLLACTPISTSSCAVHAAGSLITVEAPASFSNSGCSDSAEPAAAVAAPAANGPGLHSTLPMELVSEMLVGVLEFLAAHGCYCCISYLLAEAFKNGLLACTGVFATQQLQQLHSLQQLEGPVRHAAAAAASLVVALAAETDELEDVALPVQPGCHQRYRHSSSTTSTSTTSASSMAAAQPPPAAAAAATRHVQLQDCAQVAAVPLQTRTTSSSRLTSAYAAVLTTVAILPLVVLLPVWLVAPQADSPSLVGSATGMQPAAWCCSTLLCALLLGVMVGSLGHRAFNSQHSRWR